MRIGIETITTFVLVHKDDKHVAVDDADKSNGIGTESSFRNRGFVNQRAASKTFQLQDNSSPNTEVTNLEQSELITQHRKVEQSLNGRLENERASLRSPGE